MSNIIELAKRNADEISGIVDNLVEQELEEAVNDIKDKKNVFFSGMGRSGSMCRALAIRFMHLGFNTYVAGEPSTPAIQKNDVLIATTSSGKTKITLNHMEKANEVGAEVILITSQGQDLKQADITITIPAKTKVQSAQHAGSLFEQSVLVVGDAIAAELQRVNNVSTEYMNERHANLQ